MSMASASGRADHATRLESVSAAALRAADGLRLAAAPTFAVMALVTGVDGGGAPWVCSAVHDAAPLDGMALMYGLMAVTHLPPWLKATFGRQAASEGVDPPHDRERNRCDATPSHGG